MRIYGTGGVKQLKIHDKCKYGSVKYIIRGDGSSTFVFNFAIKSQFVYEPSFLKAKIRPRVGYVYFLKSEHGIKIGKTVKLSERMRFFGVKLPFDTQLIYSVRTEDYHDLEKELHLLLSNANLNGEWFDLTPSNWDEIKLFLGQINLELREFDNSKKS